MYRAKKLEFACFETYLKRFALFLRTTKFPSILYGIKSIPRPQRRCESRPGSMVILLFRYKSGQIRGRFSFANLFLDLADLKFSGRRREQEPFRHLIHTYARIDIAKPAEQLAAHAVHRIGLYISMCCFCEERATQYGKVGPQEETQESGKGGGDEERGRDDRDAER